jgi:GTP-binding protein
MARYFETRECLRGVVLVMDIRHPKREFDQQMLAWCDSSQLPCHILLTKADKLKRGPAQSTLLKIERDLPEIASIQVFSSLKKTGLEQLVDKLSSWYEYDDNQG